MEGSYVSRTKQSRQTSIESVPMQPVIPRTDRGRQTSIEHVPMQHVIPHTDRVCNQESGVVEPTAEPINQHRYPQRRRAPPSRFL